MSVLFVLVGMVFLVSAGTEKAQAVVSATGSGECGPTTSTKSCMFTFVKKEGVDCASCKWVTEPTTSGTVVTWTTTGGGLRDEDGSVTYKVQSTTSGATIEAKLGFSNPVFGSNKCYIIATPPTPGQSCNAGSGQSAHFQYKVKGPV